MCVFVLSFYQLVNASGSTWVYKSIDNFNRNRTERIHRRNKKIMLTFISSFFRRNRKRLLISTGIISVLYLSTKYIEKKLTEFQDRIREENFTKEQIKRRFHQTQKDCYMTFVSLVSVLNEPILKALPVENVFKELQMIRLERQLVNNESKLGASTIGSDDYPSESGAGSTVLNNNNNSIAQHSTKKTKAELWSELKITTVARFLSIIYAQSILVVVIHIQLNILSRKAYLSSAIDLASKTQGIKLYDEEEELKIEQDDTEGEKKFLSLTYYLISKGYQSIVDKVLAVVEEKFKNINVRQEFPIDDLFELIINTAEIVDLEYTDLLGLSDEESTSEEEDEIKDEKFENLKFELKSYISNEETQQVLKDLVLQNVAHVKSNIAGTMTSGKLATFLIQLTKNIPNFNSDLQLEIVDGLGDLSASVYSNF